MGYCCNMTRAGFALQAKLLAEKDCDLEITRVEVGSGVLSENASPLELTGLIAPRARATSTVPVRRDSAVDLTIEYRSDLEGAPEEMFQITEFGVFAIGAEGEEVLILYGDMSDYPEAAIPQAYGGCVRRYPVHMEIGPQAGVQLAYPAGAWLSAQDLEKALAAHDAAETSHADIRQLVQGAAQIGTQLQETVDQLQEAMNSLEEDLREDIDQLNEDKQDKLRGTKGQVVGFDEDGNAVAQEPPPSGFFPQIIVTVDEGAEVTCAQGTSSFQQTAGAEPVVFTVTEYGTWTVSAEKDGQTSNVVEVTVDAARQYHAALSFFAATITVTVEVGSTVTCTKGDDVQTATSIGAVTFTVHEVGTYTIAAEKDGQTAEEAVEITEDGQAETVTLVYAHIYGVTWDGTSTTKWTRTDDAALFTDPVPYVAGATEYGSPFDNLMPWAGIVKEERTEGTMVAIPKFWYTLEQNEPGNPSSGMKIQIANYAADGFHVSPAHMDRGDGKGECDIVYIARYHSGDDGKSITGKVPKTGVTLADACNYAKKIDDNLYPIDFVMLHTIWLLYLVEYADWNSQKIVGTGGRPNVFGEAPNLVGYTDDMPYHTGTIKESRDVVGLGIQYRNIEGLWENVFDCLAGLRTNGTPMIAITINPNNYTMTANNTYFTYLEQANVGANYPSKITVSDKAGFPMFYCAGDRGGSKDTYSCDRWYYTANQAVYFGGAADYNGENGLFCITDGTNITTNQYSKIYGFRLMELPHPEEEAS